MNESLQKSETIVDEEVLRKRLIWKARSQLYRDRQKNPELYIAKPKEEQCVINCRKSKKYYAKNADLIAVKNQLKRQKPWNQANT